MTRAVTWRPYWTLSITIIVMLSMSWPATHLTIDASTDSLLLENDPDLKFYRAIHYEYGTDVYLVIAVRFDESILSPASVERIEEITQKFKAINDVSDVTSITTIPLTYQTIDEEYNTEITFPTLVSKNIDISKVKDEFLTNPLYLDNLTSKDLKIAAFKIDYLENPKYRELYDQRYLLLDKRENSVLTLQQRNKLAQINNEIEKLRKHDNQKNEVVLKNIRNILDAYNHTQQSFISGAPLIAHDMKHYVLQDIKIFGIAALLTMAIILLIIFHSFTWVLITLFSSFLNVLIVSGLIGLFGYEITVVSSNYLAILLIFSLAIGIHVVVRYQEEEVAQGAEDFSERLKISIQHISTPCLYMVLTSAIAFLSFIISDIKPVIVFGYIMVIGLCGAYIVSFTIIPVLIQLLKPTSRPVHKHYSNKVLKNSLKIIFRHNRVVTLILVMGLMISGLGITKITVENRFIDYFKNNTEIHQGLAFIDKNLGGTVPIEIILDAPDEYYEDNGEIIVDDDELAEFDDYLADLDESAEGFTSQSYWYNRRGIKKIRSIHTYLEQIPQIGKVLSLSSTEKIFKNIIKEKELEDFQLSLIYSKLPESTMPILIGPYLSKDGNQARIIARLKDSDKTLVRNELLRKINDDLKSNFSGNIDIGIRVTGIGVLYNNVLQSLYRSQILTLGFVFISIFLMLSVLFKNIKFALIAILPNIFTALLILGMMGILNIPLNIMTITIAAIIIGIGIDDEIHYIHRYKKEFLARNDVYESILASQITVGKALWFTSITIASGFVLLVFSNFTPSIYFGLFTCLAMLISILATFSIIPLLLSITHNKA
ncbi:MAG: MMPL family transporter [Gammaproteobacteria bacterium]